MQRGQTLLSEENAQKMMDDLIRHCDNIERFGLVDYQYGVWEEQVVASKFNMVLSRSSWSGALTLRTTKLPLIASSS